MESIEYLLAQLGENLALLLAFLFIWGRIRPLVTRSGSRGDQAVLGILFGIAGGIGMHMGTEIVPGVFLDHRATLAGLAGLYGGPLGAIISTGIMIAFRLELGGIGALPGAGVAVTGGLLGVLMYWQVGRRSESVTYVHLLILGILVTAFAPPWAFMLPIDLGARIYLSSLLPLLVLYPAATVLLGSLMLLDARWQDFERFRQEDAERIALATSSAGVGIWEYNPASGETTCSPNMNEIFGNIQAHFPSDYDGFVEMLLPEDRDRMNAWVKSLGESEESEPLLYRAQWPDGTLHWYEAAGRVVPKGNHASIRFVGIVRDVTERENAQAQRALSEARLAEAQRISRIGSYESDCNSKSIYWSDGLFDMLSLSRSTFELNEANILKIVYKPDRPGYLETFDASRRNNETQEAELRVRLPDGQLRTLQHTVNSILDSSGNFIGFRGTVQDVTERNAAEARVRASERLFRAMFEQAAVGVAQINSRTGAFLRINPRYCEIVGYSEAEIRGRTFQEITHPEDLDKDLMEMKAVVAGTCSTYTLEKRYYHKDGHVVWVNLSVSALWEPGEPPNYHMAIVEDITERKQAEFSLRESEARLTESQTIARIGSWEWDVINDRAWCSDAIYTMLHIERDSLDPALPAFFTMIHPEDEPEVRKILASCVAQGSPLNFEYRHQIAGHEMMHVRVLGNPTTGEDGNVVSYRGVSQDITALRASEQALKSRELRYRRLVESLPVCIHTIDQDGLLSSINASGLCMLGAESEEGVVGNPYLDFASDGDRARIANLLREAWEGSSSEFEYEVEFEGRSRHFQSSFVPLSGPDGAIVEILGHTVDLTEIRAREAVLHELATAIDHAAEGILIADTTQHIEYANPAFLSLTGYTRDELVGQSLKYVYKDPGCQELLDTVWETVMGGQTWKGEHSHAHRDGPSYIETVTLSPVLDSHKATAKIVGLFRDVTQERALEGQLLQSQKMEAIGTLAGGIAHDFNNILHIMLGNCRHALESDLNDRNYIAHCLEEIEYGGQRASRLVEQILTFSRVTDASARPIDVAQLLRDIVQFLRGSLPASVEIALEIHRPQLVVIGDITQLHQVITNLCTNAHHAIGSGSGTITIEVNQETHTEELVVLSGTVAAGNYVVIQVTDTGAGIPPNQLERVFDPFFTTKEVGEGTGLGLSIVHGVVHRMDGAIDIASTLELGTNVSIYLPASDQKAVATPVEMTGTPAEQTENAFHILLIDDETAITDMLCRTLGKHGCTVTVFNAPGEALDALSEHKERGETFDIAICDLTMPTMNGIELSSHIRSLYPELPVILATGMLDEALIDAPPPEPIVEVLRKPFSVRSLLKTIGHHVGAATHDRAQAPDTSR